MSIRAVLIACLTLVALPVPSGAQPAYRDEVLQVDLLPGWRASADTHIAAVRLRLAPGWKTYWRAPGEGGLPPEFYVGASDNLAGLRTLFPAPEVFYAAGLRSIGYAETVVFPLVMRVQRPGEPIHFRARLELGVCEDICMPMAVDLDALLAPGGGEDRAIRAAIAAVPPRVEAAMTCAFEPISDGLRVSARFKVPDGAGPDAVAVLESGQPDVWSTDTDLTRPAPGEMLATVDFVPPRGQPLTLDRSAIRLTVIGRRTVEMVGCD